MNQFIIVYFNASALACIAEAAAAEAAAAGQLILPEQIQGYVKVLASNAYKIADRVVMKLECEEIPAPYVEFAEAIFQTLPSGSLKCIKRVKHDSHVTNVAYSADTVRYPYLKIARSTPNVEKIDVPNETKH